MGKDKKKRKQRKAAARKKHIDTRAKHEDRSEKIDALEKEAKISSRSKRRRDPAPDRNRATTLKIDGMVEAVVKASLAQRDPHIDIPMRTVSNTRYNRDKRILEMGSRRQQRNLFNLHQVKKFMQTLLVAESCKELIEADKTLSLRGMYYKNLHTILGTQEKTLDHQGDSDTALEDLEVALDSAREELHVFAKKRGTMVGNITIIDNGDEIDCRRMGSGGYAVPSICEPNTIQFKSSEADFVLHVEKDTVWSRFNEDRFWESHNCILTEGAGQPPRGVRRLLARLHRELGLPIFCLLDCDPWGHYIYSVIKQGSISLAHESKRMAVPGARFLGLRARDFDLCALSDDVKIKLTDRDTARAKQIADYPWFKDKRAWQEEIELMLSRGFKMEVESLITKDISYVTEVYVPERLAMGDHLD